MRFVLFVPALLVLSGLVSTPSRADDLPAEVKFLETLKSDETKLVDAARRYQQQQFGLMQWDRKLIEEYNRDGQSNLAKTQADTIQARSKTIRTVWEWVLAQHPKNARAHNYLGEFLYDYGNDGAGGVQHWLTAAQLDGNLGAAHNNLGVHYFHTGEYARGFDELQRALKLEPDNPDYLYNMAQMYLIHFDEIEKITKSTKEKLYKRAMEMSEKAAELSPKDFDIVQDYAVNFFAAENFGVQADWKAAVAAWRKAQPLARTDEERFFALLNEGRASLNGGNPQGAVGPLQAAIVIHPENAAAKQLLAKAKPAP